MIRSLEVMNRELECVAGDCQQMITSYNSIDLELDLKVKGVTKVCITAFPTRMKHFQLWLKN